MAVWLQIFGGKNWGKPLGSALEDCREILVNLDLDFSFLKNKLPVMHESPIENVHIYNPHNWIIAMEKTDQGVEMISALYPFYPVVKYKNIDHIDGLKIFFAKNIIEILGPFEHFSKWFTVTDDDVLCLGYQKITQKVFSAFGISEAIYATEWFITNEEWGIDDKLLDEIMSLKYEGRRINAIEHMQSSDFFVQNI